MPRYIWAALTVLCLFAGAARAVDDTEKKDQTRTKPKSAAVAKVDAAKGVITVRWTDNKGKTREQTFRLSGDVRLTDDSGRVVNIAVLQLGDPVVLVQSEGKVREIRREPNRGESRRVSDTVRTLIELAESDQACAEDLQAIYDMLQKLDTGKNGKIDPSAIKTQADVIAHERVKEIFNRLDTDKDGKISKEEARGLIKEHFDRIDTNKDGFIEFDELLKAAKERREHPAGANLSRSAKHN